MHTGIKRNIKQYIAPALWLAFVIGFYVALHHFVTLEGVRRQADYVTPFLYDWYWLLLGLYFLLYVIISALPVPGETGLSFLGGYLFGPAVGLTCIITAAVVGALMGFYGVQHWYRPRFAHAKSGLLVRVREQLERTSAWHMISLRLIPVIPFFVMNYASGLTNMSPITFAWTTAVGILPLCSLYIWTGTELRTISSLKDMLSWRVIALLSCLALLSFAPTILKKVYPRRSH